MRVSNASTRLTRLFIALVTIFNNAPIHSCLFHFPFSLTDYRYYTNPQQCYMPPQNVSSSSSNSSSSASMNSNTKPIEQQQPMLCNPSPATRSPSSSPSHQATFYSKPLVADLIDPVNAAATTLDPAMVKIEHSR